MSMSSQDRAMLVRLVRNRAKHAKSEADQRKAVLLAEVEQELSAEYSARDEMWAAAVEIAQQAAVKANAEIQRACLDLGVPAKHAPRLTYGWYGQSPEYSDRGRREQAQRLAKVKVDALTKTAKQMIDAEALKAEEALVVGGLESDEARAVAEALPTVEQLMPSLSLADLGVKHWQPPEGVAFELMAPLTTTERKRRRVLRAIERDPAASDRAIGERAGVDHKTVAALRRKRGELPSGGEPARNSPPEDGEAPG
jgi:hypothetical protein